jgi:hypothetical protein
MRVAAALVLIAAPAALAGCGTARDPAMNEQQAAAAQQRAPDPEKVMSERWAQIFAHPAAVVAAANDFDFAIPGYKTEGKGFAARGAASWPKEPGAVAVKAQFAATGPSAETIDTISFAFDVTHKGKVDRRAAELYRYPVRVVNGFLGRFEVGPGDIVNGAIRRRESAKTELHGVSAVVDAQPIKGGDAKDRHMTVTFTRTGASAPANQTQGK